MNQTKWKQLYEKYRFYDLYYILVALGYLSTLLIKGMRPGVFATLLMFFAALELALRRGFTLKTLPDRFAVLFFAYQTLSVIWLLAGGFPFSVFAAEFVASALPMVFYFAGRSSEGHSRQWYRDYLIAMLLLGVPGALFYALAPQFYNDWSFAAGYISKADAATTHVRMHSVVGSTCLSFLMVAGMLAGAYFLTKADGDAKGSNMPENTKQAGTGISRARIFGILAMALCLLFAIMANQRSGLVAAALVLVYVNVLLFFNLHLLKRKYFWIELLVLAVLFAVICVLRFDFILKYWYRIISLPTAISQRSEQWVAAVNNMYSTWLGNGLGANGHKALGIEGAHVIADGGLVKLYCENGVIGFSLWLYLLILAVKKGASRIGRYYAELGIVAVGLLQSIGSNMLAFQLCTPIFWYAVGRMCIPDETDA
ncbi:MAG: hypothetical protein J5518_01175 [Lachnospiraceae bacterium]|nr:hypothetical protein [Lachnospiraceae bacterium]